MKNASNSARLIFFCGKMAAGKSTLARELAQQEHAVLLVQDELLESLYPGEITDVTGIHRVLFAVEESSRAAYLCFVGKGHFRRPRFSW